jgi:hypothetical protein
MRIAELSADLAYRSLHFPELMAGDDTAGLQLGLFNDDSPIGAKWIPRKVVYSESPRTPSDACCDDDIAPGAIRDIDRPISDFPHFWGINYGVLSKRAFKALGELIAPHVEFLTLLGAGGEFFAFKVLTFRDALNKAESVIEWYAQLRKDAGKPRVARAIKKHAFDTERVEGTPIFRIPEMPLEHNVFVTDEFIDRVQRCELRGFAFKLVWPPIDESSQRQAFLERRAKRKRSAN